MVLVDIMLLLRLVMLWLLLMLIRVRLLHVWFLFIHSIGLVSHRSIWHIIRLLVWCMVLEHIILLTVALTLGSVKCRLMLLLQVFDGVVVAVVTLRSGGRSLLRVLTLVPTMRVNWGFVPKSNLLERRISDWGRKGRRPRLFSVSTRHGFPSLALVTVERLLLLLAVVLVGFRRGWSESVIAVGGKRAHQ